MGGEETLKEYLIEKGIISEEEIEEEGLIKLSENIYGISTYEDLKYLSESVNKGEEYKGKTIYVLNDIDCKAEYSEETGELTSGENFVPIGSSNTSIEKEIEGEGETKAFRGKLEGMGYKIERIYIKKNEEGSYCTGLIGYLGEEGEIKDLSIEKSYIQGYYETGAIVGRNRGKIINCTNESKVVGDYFLTGGIAGRNTNTIENCTNKGDIYGGEAQTAGIVGNAGNASSSEYQSEILNCYNTGYIHGIGNMGGIASWGNGFKIVNCYNIGKLYCENEERGSKGGIICNINEEANNQCINNYWLDTCGASYGINELSSNEGAESKTESELKGLASILSDKYTEDKNNINNGYPILKWQLEENNN